MEIAVGGYTLTGLARVNVIVGKNGCGKSTLLKQLDASLRINGGYGAIKYITPERGGNLQYDANVEQTLASNADWIFSSRRNNQVTQFRQQTAVQYRLLETRVLRAYERAVEGGVAI